MARRDKHLERRIAQERILTLHELAERAALDGRDVQAARCAGLARRIGMRYLVGVPTPLKRRLCDGCDGYLLPGRTARVRLGSDKVSWTCGACSHVHRYPHVRERKERRANEGV